MSMVFRYAAKSVRIRDLVEGTLIPSHKEEKVPTKIITRFGDILVRVKIVGTVVEKFVSENSNYAFIDIDDNSGLIRAKTFELAKEVEKLNIGDIVLVVGKIKEYLDEFYVNIEIVKVVDAKYELYHMLKVIGKIKQALQMVKELKHYYRNFGLEKTLEIAKESYGIEEQVAKIMVEGFIDKEQFKEKILKLIEELQEEEGVEMTKLMQIIDMPEKEVEKIIDELLEQGLIFEVMPGIYKKV